MTWVLSKKKQMSLRKGLACLSLLLLMLLQFETPCFAGVYDHNHNRFRAGSGASLSPNFKSQGGFKGSNTAKDGDDIFGAEQRKVYTGPNPLHNR
ncbi:Uncharacterized protein TCM_023923 [Theobroma cacao]|uniref:Uncharacterized protein n=1 Tax=Theobroma cacao TaxID=3641 RepID=A0A061EWJ7_THECC|nr:Uncharacterized protein TCM_023923 [Theobroma cacao]